MKALIPTPMSGYIIYARKSSEDEDRQILSIDSQVKELKSLAEREGLRVARTITESRSAKAPGRLLFNDLLREVNRKSLGGIISWKLDRLARNPVDGAALIWAVEQGRLGEIVVPGRRFTNRGDDKFWMQLEFGMAKKYVDDLSDNVRRGNRAKLEMGWLPGRPKIGYLNDRIARTIVKDPERFPLVQRIWRLILAGEPPMKVYQLSQETWALRTRVTRRGGGGLLSLSAYYALLSDPFYCGIIRRAGGTWVGLHEPMISREEFDKVQKLLGRPNRLADRSMEFAYTGLIRCGECGCSVTAEKKTNRYGSRYTYYHCTKKKPNQPCSQRVIRVEELETQVASVLKELQVPDDYLQWALDNLSSHHAGESMTRNTTLQGLERTHKEIKQQLQRLTMLHVREILPEDEYLHEREGLVKQELQVREARTSAEGNSPDWFELSERAFLFGKEAEKRFIHGSLGEKREILSLVGSHLSLKDRKLTITLEKPFQLMTEKPPTLPWWALAEGIRIFFKEHPTLIQWPSWCQSNQNTLPQGKKAGKDREVTAA